MRFSHLIYLVATLFVAGCSNLSTAQTTKGAQTSNKGNYTNLEAALSNPTKVKTLVLGSSDVDFALRGKPFPAALGKMVNLEELKIRAFIFSELPVEVSELKNLKKLTLYGDVKLPKSIAKLTRLEEVRWYKDQVATSGAVLREFPLVLCQIKSLKKLKLDFHGLTKLPPQIGNLTNLEKLYLSGNKFTTLPNEIGNLRQLTTLDLAANQLTSIPPSIGQMEALVLLKLERNKLTTLPPELGNAKNLTKLKTAGNNIPQNVLDQLTSNNTPTGRFSCGDFRHNTPPSVLISKAQEVAELELNRQAEADQVFANAHKFTNLTFINVSSDVDLTNSAQALAKFPRLKSLILSPDDGKLPADLSKCKQLESLVLLYGFSEFKFPAYVFELPKLTSLSIHGYNMTTIPATVGDLTNLKQLTLTGNYTSLPQSLSKLQNLEGLTLEVTGKIDRFPTQIFQLTKLKQLTLPKVDGDLPSSIKNLTELEELDIVWLYTDKFPKAVCSLTKLRRLKLPNVKIVPPAEFGNLTQLEELNQVAFGPVLFKLTNLRDAYFFFKKNTQVSTGIAAMSKLESLVMAFEGELDVRKIPSDFGSLKTLKELSIYKGLKGTLTAVGQLTNLERLRYKSKITGSFPIAFCSLTKLKVLKMEYADFKGIPDGFGQLVALEKVFLAGNDLGEIPACFGRLKNLKHLEASNCNISSIHLDFFNCKEVWWLSLDKNPIKTIPNEISKLSKLNRLSLSRTELSAVPNIGGLTKLYKLNLNSTPFAKANPDEMLRLKAKYRG